MKARTLGFAVAALMSLGVAACGHRERTVVVNPPATTTAPGTTVVTPPPSGTTRVCPAGATTC